MSKKIVCDYLEFVNHIKNITEDTLFVIKGDRIPLSEEKIKALNPPQDKLDYYNERNEDGMPSYGLDEVSLVLSSVKEGILIELDLTAFENFGFEAFSFEKLNCLKGIILPDTLSTLPANSFGECKNLEYVIIPKGFCERINEFAFNDCPKLTHIKIEKELDIVEWQAIEGCDNLKTVEYPKRDANYYYLKPADFNSKELYIETPRLIIKPLLKKDFKAAVNYYLDSRVTTYEDISECRNEEHVKNELRKSEKCWNEPDFTLCHFAIYLKENGENIGHIPLSHSSSRMEEIEDLKDQTGYTIGWALAYDYQKKGYATEAAKAIVEWAKSFLKMKRLWAYARKENKASIHVMEKLGMTFVKEFRFIDEDGQETTKVVYAVEED